MKNITILKRASNLGLTAITALILGQYGDVLCWPWLVLTAVLTNYNVQGRSLRRGLHVIVFILLTVSLNIGITSLHLTSALFALMIFLLNGALIVFVQKQIYLRYVIVITILMLFLSDPLVSLPTVGLFIIIGGVIGMVFGYVIFPVKLYTEFKESLFPLWHALLSYSEALRIYFASEEAQRAACYAELQQKKNQLQLIFNGKNHVYPEWVYEPGFNPGLRAGFRFFLIRLERISELYLSLNLYLQDAEKYHGSIYRLFSISLIRHRELITSLIQYFSDMPAMETTMDYVSDIQELEEGLRAAVPAYLELLDIAPEYVALTELTRGVRELRELLLELMAALPTNELLSINGNSG